MIRPKDSWVCTYMVRVGIFERGIFLTLTGGSRDEILNFFKVEGRVMKEQWR